MENYSPDAYDEPPPRTATVDPDDLMVACAAEVQASEEPPKPKNRAKVFVKDVATRCNVQEATVTKWIRTNAIPAQKVGKRWFVRECDLEVFLSNGGKMPPEYHPIENPTYLDLDPDPIDLESQPTGTTRPIMPFAAYESSKTGWTPIRGTKFPPEWSPRIARIIEKIPNYQESTGNFIRDAVFCRILDMEHNLKENGGVTEENWKIYVSSQKVIEEKMSNDRCIESLRKAALILREQRNREQWEKFYNENISLARSLPQPWRKRAIAILQNKSKEEGEI